MAAAFVGEAFLSASVEVLLERIISHEFLDFFHSKELDVSLLKKLKITLLSLQAVLNDAEEKQITNPAVKEWLDELTHAVFDADDLLDEINTKALQFKIEAGFQSLTISDQVLNFLSSPFKRFHSRMQALFQRLEQFALQKDILQLKEDVSSSIWHGTPTSSVVDEFSIYGRDDDKMILKDYLMSEDASGSSGSKIGVISIVGMGGLGKTTLAKLLYNDHEVKENFDLKAWAYISKDFDVCRVTKTILDSVKFKPVDTNDLNILQEKLQERLRNRRFLLVLDDIWDGSYVDWTNLMDIFSAGEKGSRIIVTTRDESVARAMQTSFPIYHLTPLASEDCWSLLAKHAFGANNCSERPNLEVIGKEIAKKCDGLPLAAVALGGLLRTKLSENYWNMVLKSNIWDLPNVKVLPALLLSYRHLSALLKQCFAYCSIFPKNCILEKKMVVQLWIAEGFVHQSTSEKTMEEVGDEYFDELVSRSLIHRGSVNGHTHFKMHDLINDLATMVSSSYCIRYEDRKSHENAERVRHLSYNKGEYDSLNKFDILYGLKSLRTFIALPLRLGWLPEKCYASLFLSNKVVHDLLSSVRPLRVLSLSHYYNITELPDYLGNLIHLRYLDLSNTRIQWLPYVTCKLYNLQTLLLSNCWLLTELPEDIGNLVNLRHLDVSGTNLKKMPLQIARLQNLQTLSAFVVSKLQDGLKVGELKKFRHLKGKLSISKLQNVTDPSEAFQANLKSKEQINELALEWDYGATEDTQIERLVLEQLQPPTNLKKLAIKSYGGTSFPNWFGDSSFANMVYLCISDCDHCWSLPPLGQLLSLRELYISGMKSVKTVGAEFYGSSSALYQPFPSLEILSFKQMIEWEEWNLIGGTTTNFLSLSHLTLKDCPKLKGTLPKKLPSSTFELSGCPLLFPNQMFKLIDISPTNLATSVVLNCTNFILDLTLSGISSPTSFPRDGLPTTLRSLTLRDCENLEFLPRESLCNYTSLEELEIRSSCCSLTSFTLGCLPVLKSLAIMSCKHLKSISIAENATQTLLFLQRLSISCCPELESFPANGLPTPNLTFLDVSMCDKLNSLPEPINILTGLRALCIQSLPNLQSFAKEGLPINLQSFTICSHGSFWTTTISEWGLQQLNCLSTLHIGGDDLLNALMKKKVPLLSTSLVSLCIYNLSNVKCLDGKWLQHLTSLENLEISYSPQLESLPEEGLPSSLSVLTIERCPLLEANCHSNGGKEWPKIAHIPCIIINRQVII